MLNETFQPGQLAAAAARVSANGLNSVTYFVRLSHQKKVTWSPTNVLTFPERLELPETMLMETHEAIDGPTLDLVELLVAREELLFFSCGDVEFFVSTRGTKDPEAVPGEVTAAQVSEARDDFHVFEGRTVLNPGFLYEFARPVEVLIDFGPHRFQPTAESATAATLIFAELAKIAAVVGGAPILFMHAPGAPYEEPSAADRRSPKQEALRRARGMTLRMSIGILATDTEGRLKVYEQVADLCSEWGLGLHIGDRMPDRVRGEWVPVRNYAAKTFETRLAQKRAGLPPTATSHALPITVLGPARIGSTNDILGALRASGVSIVGLSVSALQEVAFINILLVSPPDLDIGNAHVFPLAEGLQTVVHALTGRVLATNELGDLSAASDYKLLVGKPHPVRPDEDGGEVQRPIWLAWDLPFTQSAVLKVLDLTEKMLKSRGVSFEVEYARSRVIGTGRVRGRAKLAVVPESGRDVRDFLTGLAKAVEGKVRMELARGLGVSDDEVNLRVRWRERRLGSWDIPL